MARYNPTAFSFDEVLEGIPVRYVGDIDEDGVSFSVALRSTDPKLDNLSLDDLICDSLFARIHEQVEEMVIAYLKDEEDEYAIMRWESQRDSAWA